MNKRGRAGRTMKRAVKRRNPAAAALRSPKFRPKVVRSAKHYQRAALKRQRPDDADDPNGHDPRP